MPEFNVGDTLYLCAAVHDFCGATYQAYFVGDVNLSKSPQPCTINIDTSPCLPLSGIQIEFQWTNAGSGLGGNDNCTSGTMLKSLGTVTTNSQGVASMSYILTEEDATFYKQNNTFELRACIRSPVTVVKIGAARGRDPIIIRDKYIGNLCTSRSASICLNDQTLIVYENPVYTPGMITEVCVHRSGFSTPLPEAKIKAFRLVGTTWHMVGESSFLPLQNDAVTTFNFSNSGLNIVVQKGDYIGIYVKHPTTGCISSNGSAGIYYAKTHTGDVIGVTSDIEWQSIQYYKTSISATIVPCQGVTCPDICVGYNLYYQTCNPTLGCIQGTLKEVNSPICGYIPPGINKYEFYYKIVDIIPAWLVSSVLGVVYNGAVDVIRDFTDYYIEGVEFDPNTYILTVTMTSYVTVSGIQSLVPPSDSALNALAASITLLILFALGVISAPVAAIAFGAVLIVNYAIVTFLGKRENVGAQLPSTRVITLDAKICTGDATNPCKTSSPLTDPNMVVLIDVIAGKEIQTGSITTTTPTATFSIPTNVDVSITAKVKDNPYYTIFTADPQSNSELKSCTPGTSCPTTIPITIRLFAQADAKVAPKLTDTSGNPLPGRYILWIEDNRGVKSIDGRGDLVNGEVPQVVIPPNKEYCIATIPSDYPTHDMAFMCSSCSAGEICSPTLVSKTCIEKKNSVTVRCVYISASGARLGFVPDEIDITDIASGIVRKILPGIPTIGSACPGVITSDITCIEGLEKNKTYKVHIISSKYTVTSATQDQQVSYTTDCNTGILLTVEASPPPDTYDIIIQVKNDQTLTALPGAIVTLGTMPAESTDSDGSVMFASVPKETGIPLKVTLTGYKNYTDKIDITSSRTITVLMSVDQVLQTVHTRIINFGTIGDVIATKSVKFKGTLQYLDGTTFKPLPSTTIVITIKDDVGNIIKTMTVITDVGKIGGLIDVGDFETGEWLVPDTLVGKEITVTTSFEGVGRYMPSSFETNYVVHKAEACIIPIPFTNSCLLSKETGKTILLVGGLLIAGYVAFKIATSRATAPIPVPITITGKTTAI